ncbi:MAG: ABC transporter permease [Ruminococcus sp.]|nr:ABC transporter permease [Ruminococcus sp.]
MNGVLRKRLPRELRSGFGRYLALMLLIVMGIYLIVGIVGSAEMIMQGTVNKRSMNKVEDGQFSVFLPLTDDETESLSEGGTVIEPHFSLDLKAVDGSVLRMFETRNDIDLIQLDSGRLAENKGETVIEKGYAKAHSLGIGNRITAAGTELEITGIGSVPDYDMMVASFSDTAVEHSGFGLIFVTEAQYAYIRDNTTQKAEEYTYAYRLGSGITDSSLKEKIKSLKFDYTKIDNKYFKETVGEALEQRGQIEHGIGMLDAAGQTGLADSLTKLVDDSFNIDIDNLTSFIEAKDNPRIEAASGDMVMDKNAGLVAGVIVLILFAYVISVFVVHQIEREQSVIGSLYALGVKKNDLLRHYITLPTLVAFIGGVIGAALGFSPLGVDMQAQDAYTYFSVPDYEMIFPPYLVIYACVLPTLICAAVNAVFINKKLDRTALSLIRNEQSAGSYRRVNIRAKSFTRLFAIRQLIRESRSAIAVTLGMLVSLLVVMLGFNTFTLCLNVKSDTVADTKYEYMYLFKYPEKTVPEGGEGAYIETLSIDCMGYTQDVSVIGLDGESRYFSARPEKGKTRAVINNSLAERYGYKKGDRVIFTDAAADTDYCFTVTDVVQYSPGFTIFMDIESMRELFGKDEGYFNAVYSGKALDIDEGRLYSVTTKEDIRKSAGVFIDMMTSLIVILLAAGIIIFCVVMYLMLGVMIDRSAMGISLIKIFGYRPKEIRQLYLNGNLAVIAFGSIVTIPIAKSLMDRLYPSFIPNVACTMKLSFPWYMYLMIWCAMMIVYLVINKLLMRRINRISPAEILKDRE